MSKVGLPEITSGYLSADKINEAFQIIENAFDNTISRAGDTPNSMEASLDMNSNRVLNLPTPASDGEPATYGLLKSLASGAVLMKLESQTAVAGQTVFNLTNPYSVGSNNLGVFVNGTRKFPIIDFVEVSPTQIEFNTGLLAGQRVVFLSNEFLGSVDVTEPTSVAWSILTGVPSFASRWPTWSEVSSKPAEFAPSPHVHDAGSITTGTLADAHRGVYVQATAPTLGTGDAGALWFW